MEPIAISVSDTIPLRDALVTTTHVDGQEQGIRYADSDEHAASADLSPDGSALVGVQGVIPSGAGFELPTARTFVEYQRGLDLHLGEPRKPEGSECGIDCIADNLDNLDEPVCMQITNAIGDKSYWKKQTQSVNREYRKMSVDERVAHLWQAANEKRSRARRDTILLLSAWLSLAHATSEVAKRFRAIPIHGSEAGHLGFKEVWVVGTNTAHTFRLDT